MDMTRKLFKTIGVNDERLAFRQCSSGEASVFVELVTEFDEKIRGLGPLGGKGDFLNRAICTARSSQSTSSIVLLI
jgi:coenzyme F420-reducing hydrogenase delta subunit